MGEKETGVNNASPYLPVWCSYVVLVVVFLVEMVSEMRKMGMEFYIAHTKSSRGLRELVFMHAPYAAPNDGRVFRSALYLRYVRLSAMRRHLNSLRTDEHSHIPDPWYLA